MNLNTMLHNNIDNVDDDDDYDELIIHRKLFDDYRCDCDSQLT